jgi:hypothetical protein
MKRLLKLQQNSKVVIQTIPTETTGSVYFTNAVPNKLSSSETSILKTELIRSFENLGAIYKVTQRQNQDRNS